MSATGQPPDNHFYLLSGLLLQLHGEAVDAAMLANDGSGIYTDDVSVWEGKLYLLACLLVLRWLIIGWIYHSLVQYQEVGISGRQAVALAVLVCSQAVILIKDWVWHRELEQSIRVSFPGEKRLKLLFKCLEVFILLIFRVITPYI